MLSVFCFASSASNRLIHAKDHASVQLVIADVDPATGRAGDAAKMYVVCGAIRRMGESDDCIVRLTKKDGILTKFVHKICFYLLLRIGVINSIHRATRRTF